MFISYGDFSGIHEKAGEALKPWISDSTWKHTENRRLFKNQLHSTPELAKESELGLLYKSADSKVKERASNDKETFCNKIAREAEAAAYRNNLSNVNASIKDQ